MIVFKFGGASINDANSIKNIGRILQNYTDELLVVVVSAMGKTTNELEAVVKAYLQQNDTHNNLLNAIAAKHLITAQNLFGATNTATDQLAQIFVDLQNQLNKPPRGNTDFIYDSIVSVGEIAASVLLSAWLNHCGLPNQWLDARDCILTDNHYREGNVQWQPTCQAIVQQITNLDNKGVKWAVTQGFIGGTPEHLTTTLGREGSDYTAAIFANALDAQYMAVWKDVAGIYSGDPRIVPTAVKINNLSYREAVEMTFYGAKVIHPKTIKPLQNKKIPLYVRSFLQPTEAGTLIHTQNQAQLPPIIVYHPNQIQLTLFTRDFSFIAEHYLSEIYQIFARYEVKCNLTQNGATHFLACIDHVSHKLPDLLTELNTLYNVEMQTGLEILTIRHYNAESITQFTQNRQILLQQQSLDTVQYVLREEENGIKKSHK
ncbi:MAG: aspartate kinase [Bacteroidetes bacterium]|nr:aspartate kinase [Sphingobacteriales bacterium]MBP9142026.1 aspartate kinase [Chitinophagales bacterium]MDA0198990.1 aspartate kinase [Bacteroidota bacterium]